MTLQGSKKFIGIALGLVVVLFFVYRFFWYASPLPVIQVKVMEIQGQVQGPGTVQSKIPVAVSTKITGILEKLYADQGDRVRKGQLLAEIDSLELRARAAAAQAAKNRAQRELTRAQADLGKAQANLNLAQSNYQRDLEVFKPGYISQAAFDTTKAQLKVAESEVHALQAMVKAAQAAVQQAESETHAAQALHNYTRILAPMDGLITDRKAEVGTTLSPGTPIFQLVDLDTVWVAAWIDQSQLAQIKAGQQAAISLRSGRRYQGRVARLNAEADTVTRELEVDVTFDQLPDPLVMGEEANVNIFTGKELAPAVPLAAILRRDSRHGVLVVKDGRAEFRPVTLGLHDGKKTAVLNGLKAGEMVVLKPGQVKPGQRIKPLVKTGPDQGV